MARSRARRIFGPICRHEDALKGSPPARAINMEMEVHHLPCVSQHHHIGHSHHAAPSSLVTLPLHMHDHATAAASHHHHLYVAQMEAATTTAAQHPLLLNQIYAQPIAVPQPPQPSASSPTLDDGGEPVDSLLLEAATSRTAASVVVALSAARGLSPVTRTSSAESRDVVRTPLPTELSWSKVFDFWKTMPTCSSRLAAKFHIASSIACAHRRRRLRRRGFRGGACCSRRFFVLIVGCHTRRSRLRADCSRCCALVWQQRQRQRRRRPRRAHKHRPQTAVSLRHLRVEIRQQNGARRASSESTESSIIGRFARQVLARRKRKLSKRRVFCAKKMPINFKGRNFSRLEFAHGLQAVRMRRLRLTLQPPLDPLEPQANPLGRQTFQLHSLRHDVQVEKLAQVPQGAATVCRLADASPIVGDAFAQK